MVDDRQSFEYRAGRWVAIVLAARAIFGLGLSATYMNLFGGVPKNWDWQLMSFYFTYLCETVALVGGIVFFLNRLAGIYVLLAAALLEFLDVADDILINLHGRLPGPFYAWKWADFRRQFPVCVGWNLGEVWLPLLCFLILRNCCRTQAQGNGVGFAVT